MVKAMHGMDAKLTDPTHSCIWYCHQIGPVRVSSRNS